MATSQRNPPSTVAVADADITLGSVDRFGYEWNTYSEIAPEYETQFRRWLPFLGPDDWRGVHLLDVGCGMGRNSYWPLRYGAASATSIDLDERTLAAARRLLAPFPNCTVERMSAYDIRYRDRFDVVYSIGVIHHLEQPQRAVDAMAAAARPGGRVLMWVYGYENNEWIVRFCDPVRKALFSRLPIRAVHHLSLYPAAVLWLLLRAGLNRLAYFRLLRTFTFPHLRSIVFDQMLPKIAHYWRREEAEALLRRAGLQQVESQWVNEMSWSVIGTKVGGTAAPPAAGA